MARRTCLVRAKRRTVVATICQRAGRRLSSEPGTVTRRMRSVRSFYLPSLRHVGGSLCAPRNLQLGMGQANTYVMVCPECVHNEADGHTTCSGCGGHLMPFKETVVLDEACPWCVLTSRAGRDRCEVCGRATDPSDTAAPSWEGVSRGQPYSSTIRSYGSTVDPGLVGDQKRADLRALSNAISNRARRASSASRSISR